MRVLLARPNSPLQVAPAPLGLGYLSHALKTMRGDQILILDGRRFRLSPEAFLARAEDFRPEAIGFTAMTFEAPETIALIARCKERWPEVPVIFGGPHVTGFGPGLLEHCRADYLAPGEGEITLTELLDALEGKRPLAGVAGVVRRERGAIVSSGPRAFCDDLSLLAADWEAMGPEHYFSIWRRNALNTIAVSNRRLPIFFSRGCPFGCAYCHHIFGRKYRTFPVERVAAEMVALRDRYRLSEFEIVDDTFNLDLDRAKAAMREIIGRRLNCALALSNGIRADRMDSELLGLMKAAGVYRVDYAIETASPRLHQLMHKNLDLDRAREVVNMTAAHRIVTGGYYMLGFPTETRAEMEATIEYALSLRNHIASFFYLMPFPGTEVAEADPAVSQKVRALTFRDASGIAVNLSAATDAEMRAVRRAGYRRVYFSPGRMARIARDVPKNLRLAASALAVARLSCRESVNY